jgi:hypothetical protein
MTNRHQVVVIQKDGQQPGVVEDALEYVVGQRVVGVLAGRTRGSHYVVEIHGHHLGNLCNGLDMKTHLNCPCGEAITGKDEDDLVEKAQAHLSEAHPGREYDRDAILFMAY